MISPQHIGGIKGGKKCELTNSEGSQLVSNALGDNVVEHLAKTCQQKGLILAPKLIA